MHSGLCTVTVPLDGPQIPQLRLETSARHELQCFYGTCKFYGLKQNGLIMENKDFNFSKISQHLSIKLVYLWIILLEHLTLRIAVESLICFIKIME